MYFLAILANGTNDAVPIPQITERLGQILFRIVELNPFLNSFLNSAALSGFGFNILLSFAFVS